MKLEIKGKAHKNYKTDRQSPQIHSHASNSDKKEKMFLMSRDVNIKVNSKNDVKIGII